MLHQYTDSTTAGNYFMFVPCFKQVNIPQYISDTASEEDTVYDRTIWASERLSLQMALNSAEHEIQRLRSEIHNFKSSVIVNGHGTHTDPDKVA